MSPYHEPGVTRSSEMAGQSPQPQVAYVDAQTELYAEQEGALNIVSVKFSLSVDIGNLRLGRLSCHLRGPSHARLQTELYADDVERSFLRAERLRRGYKLDMIHPTLMPSQRTESRQARDKV
jgi:hypothetical protein